ncbi:MAG: hypothetical protein WAU57_02450 [Xanthobacteraceae bacterium]
MKTRADMDKIARGLGAERRGKAAASGGYFGAMQRAALLLEKKAEEMSEGEAESLVHPERHATR